VIFNIATAEMTEGNLPPRQIRLMAAWIELHREELQADWDLASRGELPFKIDPLR
jgi:hypothetical protein